MDWGNENRGGIADIVLGFVLTFGLGACVIGLAAAVFLTFFPEGIASVVEFFGR
jgi:hypothetical protein